MISNSLPLKIQEVASESQEPLPHAERGPGVEGAAQAGSQLRRELFSKRVIRRRAAVRRDRESPGPKALRNALLGMGLRLFQLSDQTTVLGGFMSEKLNLKVSRWEN